MNRSELRLQIATSLLRGKLVEKPANGYDPGGFYPRQVQRIVAGAIEMAEELIEQNSNYEGKGFRAASEQEDENLPF